VFESLLGIAYVNQGWIASSGDNPDFSEAVEVYFDPAVIPVSDLIEIYLHTYASRSNHSMRGKYRSAIYAYDDSQFKQAIDILNGLREDFDEALITQVYPIKSFRQNKLESFSCRHINGARHNGICLRVQDGGLQLSAWDHIESRYVSIKPTPTSVLLSRARSNAENKSKLAGAWLSKYRIHLWRCTTSSDV
jgi:hypothetical protein